MSKDESANGRCPLHAECWATSDATTGLDITPWSSATVEGRQPPSESVHRTDISTAEERVRFQLPAGFSPAMLEAPGKDANIYSRVLDYARAAGVETRDDAEALARDSHLERRRIEAHRREVGAILAEDAREHPEFAGARLAGAMAAFEHRRLYCYTVAPSETRAVLWELHRYEAVRGGARTPERSVDPGLHTQSSASVQAALVVYERERGR